MAKISTSAKQIATAETRAAVLKLRLAGKTLAEIGQILGISTTTAHRHIKKTLAEYRNQQQETISELVTLELARLERLQVAIFIEAAEGNLKAIDRVLKIMERRAKLTGLDAPAKSCHTDTEGNHQPTGVAIIPPIFETQEQWLEAVRQQQSGKV
ncbi:hypothetical protein D5085_02790 [Ectothiorhodospiraceae bacterium BW-2]|nr:hypothetical protein D5085_02790 [Ectothiorhodospiraceae bacterium BW-2]